MYVEPAARRLGVASSLAVLCARNLSARWRMAIYAAAAFVVTMIALSRMYLQAHWPSDVLAGLLFGTGVVSVFAFVIHDRPIAGSVGKMAAILGLVLAIVYPFHVRSSFDTAKIKYANQLQIQAMTTRIG
ncbi:phosphatase PAP2 family protein [Phyllobacterium zundukense]|uniref:phosphatase PAP2 family protein n=1 Tax=Phyllobacterium zundukense TaxID=1867719 RepID=UPI0023EA52A4|nr:phosphatase PAP2 family protein [Phyllobacterium zundukense]